MGQLNAELLLNLLNRSLPYTSRIQAAVAYAQANHPFFETCREKNIRLVFYGLLDEDAAVAPNLLSELLAWGPSKVECRLLKGNYHPKVIWWHGFGAYIGSANLTHAAWFHNVECGVFFDELELETAGVADELERMFEHLRERSVPLSKELLQKIEALAVDRRAAYEAQKKLRAKYESLLKGVPDNPALTVVPPKGQKENKALKRFVVEWTETLQLLRGLAQEFAALQLRPHWVRKDAHTVIHFDQFLHAYYYDYVRGGLGEDETEEDDDDEKTLGKVERSYERHKADPQAALREGAKWWGGLASAPYGEDEFISSTGPGMASKFSRAALQQMTQESFRESVRHVNAFRMHARQTKNSFFGLPEGHKEKIDQRVDRLANWLWAARTHAGRGVKDLLSFVIWGADPSDMEQRLWVATRDDAWALPHLGQSALGEAVGWARPDAFPPRNNRTNKALRALGHDVKLFYKG